MPKGQPKLLAALGSVCDGVQNFSVAQAARLLNVPQNRMHKYVHEGRLHPVRVSGHLIFARSDLDRLNRGGIELELTRRFHAGDHPLDVYLEADGRVPLRQVEQVLRDWAKLTGVWLVEGPRGSYARWLERFGLLRVNPRALRRLIEALLVDQQVGERVRAYFEADKVNGLVMERPRTRSRKARGSTPAMDVA